MAALVIKEPNNRRHMFRFAGPQVTIGRGTGNQLTLTDTSVSRAHARLLEGERGWVITDLRSRNGVWVNGRRVQNQYELKSTDMLKIGDYEMIYFGEDSSVVGFRGVDSWEPDEEDDDAVTSLSESMDAMLDSALQEEIGLRRERAIIRPMSLKARAVRPGRRTVTFGGKDGLPVVRNLDLGPACEVTWEAGTGHLLRRLSWYAGITINGDRLGDRMSLEPDDEIVVGTSIFHYRIR